MAKYSFQISLEGTVSSAPYNYVHDLTPYQEDHPETVFTPEVREQMRQHLQQKTAYRLSPVNLQRIVDAWIADIREGYRNTVLTLNLPLLINDQINQLNEPGNQTVPNLAKPDLLEVEPQGGQLPPLTFS